ncbi:Putative invertase inhibitor [Apostasia shenzhenica]|uniref:Invertase inhibitor n=1 Tax=Apostasia shenzhenica TaxID=1088818 RepID=A0A2I0AWT0_9ASPA|nr:Putative invertase inhibitor [Apostasia shenzhenica]
MKPINLFFFFLFLLSPSADDVEPTALEAVCRKAAELVPETAAETYSFCISSLSPAAGNKAGDGRSFAVLASTLSNANYTHNLGRARELLTDGSGLPEAFRPAVEACAAGYRDGIQHIGRGIASVESGDVYRALFHLQEAWKRAVACGEGLNAGGGGGGMSPWLSKENSDALRTIGLAIKLTLLLKL